MIPPTPPPARPGLFKKQGNSSSNGINSCFSKAFRDSEREVRCSHVQVPPLPGTWTGKAKDAPWLGPLRPSLQGQSSAPRPAVPRGFGRTWDISLGTAGDRASSSPPQSWRASAGRGIRPSSVPAARGSLRAGAGEGERGTTGRSGVGLRVPVTATVTVALGNAFLRGGGLRGGGQGRRLALRGFGRSQPTSSGTRRNWKPDGRWGKRTRLPVQGETDSSASPGPGPRPLHRPWPCPAPRRPLQAASSAPSRAHCPSAAPGRGVLSCALGGGQVQGQGDSGEVGASDSSVFLTHTPPVGNSAA